MSAGGPALLTGVARPAGGGHPTAQAALGQDDGMTVRLRHFGLMGGVRINRR